MVKWAEETLKETQLMVDVLDLSLLTSSYHRNIHPCKGCASTAMPLCHWPCSCYPNHSLGQTSDWINEIYERWIAAHAVIIVTPVYWYQSPGLLKLMIDRLVCADGGNPDPTVTHGKKPAEAKALELSRWNYPKHLAGRVSGLVVHGDVVGIEGSRRGLSDWLDWLDWLDWMGLDGTGWDWWTLGPSRGWTGLLATTNPMPPVMTPWTQTPRPVGFIERVAARS